MTPFLLCALLAADPPGIETPEALVARIAPQVEAIRGLKFKRPVAVRSASAAEARAYFAERAKRLWPEERVRLDQRVYEQLGLLPAGFDLLGSYLDLLEDQALGFYDPQSGAFTIVEGQDTAAVAPILVAHELTHALDDQHFDLERLLEGPAEDDDRASAAGAVVEGSGTAVMTVFMLREVGAGRLSVSAVQEMQRAEAARAARLRAAPSVIQRSLMASYVLGLSFLMRGQPGRIVAGIVPSDFDRAFTDPPRSTRDILHPEAYWGAAERAVRPALALPDLSARLGAGWSLKGRGTLGELVLGSLVGVPTPAIDSPDVIWPARWTSPAAAGSAGDVFHHYANGARSVTLLATTWRTEQDAAEFQDALRTVPRSRSYRGGSAVSVLAGDELGPDAEAVAAAALQSLLR
jgi:hypothetical protein